MRDLYPVDIAELDRSVLEEAIQLRTQVIPVGGDVVLARILGRHKIFLSTSDLGLSCHLMMDGFWEIWLTRFFANTLRPGMRVADVGANFGYYTLLFADIVGADGVVVAVEPNPAVAAQLRRTLQLNGLTGRAHLVEMALGAEPRGEVDFFVPEGEPKNAAVGLVAGLPGTQLRVESTNLASLAARFGNFDLIKIDAEGAEDAIIAGIGEALFAARPALLLEFNTGRGPDPAGLLHQLVARYGAPRMIDFDGNAVATDNETILTTQCGEDWLLYFAAAPEAATAP